MSHIYTANIAGEERFVVFLETAEGQIAPWPQLTREAAEGIIEKAERGELKPGDKIVPKPDDWPLDERPV
jgi:hypothetical protein